VRANHEYCSGYRTGQSGKGEKLATQIAVFSCRTKDCGMSWMTSHNKAVHGLVGQPVMAYVGHICFQLSVATLAAAGVV